jgi:hypothetical protein
MKRLSRTGKSNLPPLHSDEEILFINDTDDQKIIQLKTRERFLTFYDENTSFKKWMGTIFACELITIELTVIFPARNSAAERFPRAR